MFNYFYSQLFKILSYYFMPIIIKVKNDIMIIECNKLNLRISETDETIKFSKVSNRWPHR